MDEISIYVGLDVHAVTISACVVAAEKRSGEEIFSGTFAATPEALGRLIGRVAKLGRAQFCYEAGPCGYGVYRQIIAAGHECLVVAPSLIPHKPGERIKTDQRDAKKLARLLRAGELSAIWVPGPTHEAMRDLIRMRHQAVRQRVSAQLRLLSFLLRQGRKCTERRWSKAWQAWAARQEFSEPAHQFVFKQLMDAISDAQVTAKRIETEMMALLPQWPVAPLVEALLKSCAALIPLAR